MQIHLKVPGPLQIICRTSLEVEARRKGNEPLYHECLSFGGSLKFPHDKRTEGHYEDAVFLAEISPRAVSGFQGRAQQIYETRIVSLLETSPLATVGPDSKPKAAK